MTTLLERRVIRVFVAVGAVGLVTLLLTATSAARSTSALVYVLVVLLVAALLGGVPAAAAVLAAVVAQSYYFNPPIHSFKINQTDILVDLVVFSVTATVTSVAFAHISELRRRAAIRELEARAQLERSRQLDREATAARIEAAEELSRAAFLSSMTHNLRTPLASIKAAISTLRSSGDDLPPASRERLLVTAGTQTERLERLVTKVLTWSRVTAGTIVARPEPVDLTHVCSDAIQLLGSLTSEGRVRLEADDDASPVWVDPTLVSLALSCLIENALRYAPPDRPIVVRADGEADRCVLSVIDHGPGVPASERDRIFEQFARGEGVDDATGTGLGLPIARACATAQGGTLDIEDTPGGGATFVIRLPGGTIEP